MFVELQTNLGVTIMDHNRRSLYTFTSHIKKNRTILLIEV